jgi:hypothetical protein
MLKGDGDQSVLGVQFIAEQVDAPWFPGRLTGSPAKLFLIENSALRGRHIAISSRTNHSLEEQFATAGGYASVIVHSIECPGPEFLKDAKCTTQLGMALIQLA